jgi:hypothetical protein
VTSVTNVTKSDDQGAESTLLRSGSEEVHECLSEEKEGIRISGIGDSHKPQGEKIPLFPPFAKGDGKKNSPLL